MSESPISHPDPEQSAEQPVAQPVEQPPEESGPNRMTGPILTTGELLFHAMTNDGPVEHRVDLLWLKLTCEETERENELRSDAEGRLLPSSQFLDDLAARIGAKVSGCTPTMAYQMWIAASKAMTELKNAMSGMPN